MIVRSILYDLIGAKQWSSISFMCLADDPIQIQSILEFYYDRIQNELFENGCVKRIDSSQSVSIHEIEKNTLLLVVFDSIDLSVNEEIRISELVRKLADSIVLHGTRETSKHFEELAGELLAEDLHVTFVNDELPPPDNKSGVAVARMKAFLEKQNHIAIGPFKVKPNILSFSRATDHPEELVSSDTAGVVVIIGKPVPDVSIVQGINDAVRTHKKIPLLITPGSDEELELARRYEVAYQMDLCDSVSEKPTYLLLSVLAMLGFTDMHPEYAQEIWPIDSAVDEFETGDDVSRRIERVGHQAFYVVNKATGDPIFTYFYVSQDEVYQRAPNVVAAITSFNMGTAEANRTSVVQVGNLVYALIEVDDLIFTLVTGQTDDVESIRLQFSFLPDLWKDEAPEFLQSTGDQYASPPFTLKLLATLPPEEFHSKMRPCRVTEPEWNRFKSREVRDFLKAVWESLDGSIEMKRLTNGTGPKMTLGAIHFLKAMGAIDMRLDIKESNRPVLSGRNETEVRRLYSHIDQIISLMDGKRTIGQIGEMTGIQGSVLVTVISDLCSRGIVTIDD